ncbi:glycosyltransferase [Sphingomonas sp. 1P06PA]|uniref:glycosyltransferase n=1 Tax=Sphingomonas sp. 1P06PA TaxID=554121 RepID=UPI0039A5A87C
MTAPAPEVTFYPDVRMNPYLAIVAEGLRALGATVHFGRAPNEGGPHTILHIHWAEGIALGRFARRSLIAMRLGFLALYLRIRAVKAKGGAIVWTAHNLRPHEASGGRRGRLVDRWLAKIYAQADGVTCMSDISATQVAALYPELADRIRVIRHPDYRDHYATVGTGAGLPAAVPAGATVLAMAGIVRPYKRIEQTIARFAEIAREDEWLVVAGACYDPALAARITALAERTPRVVVQLGELSDADYAALVAAAGVTLVMQDGLLNSGSLISSLSLGTPAIAIEVPANRELAGIVGAGWLTLIDDLDGPGLRIAIDGARRGVAGAPQLEAFDPARVARQHLDLYRAVLAGREAA